MKYRTEIEAVANEKALPILQRKGVISVQEGVKKVGGLPTGDLCITVGVEKKIPKNEVLPHDLIPGEYFGIKTDVVEVPVIYPESRLGKMRPVQGGISLCDANYAAACTLGAVVKCKLTGRLVALTNNHCTGMLYDTNYATPDRAYKSDFVKGIPMIQPSSSDGGSLHTSKLGVVLRAVPMIFGLSAANQCDSAICSIDELGAAWFSMYESYTGPFLFAATSALSEDLEVWKSGRTTGVRSGSIDVVSLSINVQYGTTDNDRAAFTDLIKVRPLSHNNFSMGGDSGSCITAEISGDEYIIGHHFAGDGTNGFAGQIEHVADQLNIEAWNGAVVLPRGTGVSVYVEGVAFSEGLGTMRPVTHEEGEAPA